MCLNKQILSAWIDNEIPSPWDQKIGTHIAACTSCQKAVKKYSHIKDVLHEPDIVASDSLERVWNRLEPVFVKKANKNLNRGSEKKASWKGKVFHLPMYVITTAAILLIVLTGSLFSVLRENQVLRAAAFMSNEIPSIIQQPYDMDTVMQYLDDETTSFTFTINLPRETRFESPGKPVIIKMNGGSE